MRYLVTPNRINSKIPEGHSSVPAEEIHAKIQERLLLMNPILESFGNAATTRNANSSRFGRLNKLYFSEKNVCCGSGVQTYLLERSRVTHRNCGERNFHVFYQLLRGTAKCILRIMHRDFFINCFFSLYNHFINHK